jgi:phenylacetate-CoA ligase
MGAIKTIRLLHQVRKNQWLKTSELEELQSKKLRAMVKHAYENTEFYHRKFKDAGIRPEDIKTMDDLEKVPFTTKEELREHSTGSILANGVDLSKCLVTETSGSTGIPTKVVYDVGANDYSKAVNLRSHIENGLRIRSKWVVFGDPHHFQKQQWFQKLRIFSPIWISYIDTVDEQISRLCKLKPDVLEGYPSSIRLLVKAIEDSGIEDIKPKTIFGTAELLDRETRRYINSVFDVEMVDLFGCVELNRTAWECREHEGYHMDIDAVVMEFIKDGESVSAGERGEIVYTGLYNYAMPLIRYEVGDVGVPSDETCHCGRGLPLMKVVEGRTDSFMQVPDGRIFSPIIWTAVMRRIPGVWQFKAIQEKKDLIRIMVVKAGEFSQMTIDQIEHAIKEVMGDDVNVETEIVDEIPKDKSGKVRAAESKVRIDW